MNTVDLSREEADMLARVCWRALRQWAYGKDPSPSDVMLSALTKLGHGEDPFAERSET